MSPLRQTEASSNTATVTGFSTSKDGWIYGPHQSTSLSRVQPTGNSQGHGDCAMTDRLAADRATATATGKVQPIYKCAGGALVQPSREVAFDPQVHLPHLSGPLPLNGAIPAQPTYYPAEPVPMITTPLASQPQQPAIPQLQRQAAPQPVNYLNVLQAEPFTFQRSLPQAANQADRLVEGERSRKRRRETSPEPQALRSSPRYAASRSVIRPGVLSNNEVRSASDRFDSAIRNIRVPGDAATRALAQLRHPEGQSSLGGGNALPRQSYFDGATGFGSNGNGVQPGESNTLIESNSAGALSEAQMGGMQNQDRDQLAALDTLYGENTERNNVDHWLKIYRLMDRVVAKQDEMSRSMARLRARDGARPSEASGSGKKGSHSSPPEPPEVPEWNQSIPCTLPAGRRSRTYRRTLLLGIIREVIFKLLNRSSIRGSLPPPPPVSVQVPTVDNFFIRWDESERSAFNRIACAIMTQKITRDQPGVILTAEELRDLPDMVAQHVKYLCRRYKNENREDAEDFNAKRLKRCSADSRKRTLFECRLRIIDRFPVALGKHRQLFVHLGPAGMSSDEEDEENPGTYKIRHRPELSSRVAQLKRDLDHAYALYYKGPGSKGSQLHRRVPSTLVSTRPLAVVGLPITCMNRTWLRGLSEAEKEIHSFQPHKYDYGFPTELLRNDATYERVRGSSVESEEM